MKMIRIMECSALWTPRTLTEICHLAITHQVVKCLPCPTKPPEATCSLTWPAEITTIFTFLDTAARHPLAHTTELV